jgi:hypothetical protein
MEYEVPVIHEDKAEGVVTVSVLTGFVIANRSLKPLIDVSVVLAILIRYLVELGRTVGIDQ